MNVGTIPAKHARLHPNREAVIDATTGRRVTFGELENRVRRLGNGLRGALGLAPGDRIAILSKNSVEFLEVYFAAGRRGLISQPLNWRLGVAEMARILENGAPRAIVFSSEFEAEATELRALVAVEHWLEYGGGEKSYESLLDRSDDTDESIEAVDADPFFILYTGGTTGESKGALHTHGSATMGMLNQTVAERIVPHDVYMLTGQMFHIPMVLAMNYLAHGCPLVLMNFDARLALELIQRERVSAFLGITTMLNWMMAESGFSGFDLSSLRNIQYGGGPMPPNVVQAVLESFPCEVIQGYGQTEGATMTFLSQEDHRDALQGVHAERLHSCGREGFVTEIRVADSDGHTTPRDGTTTGEILVRSPANMREYWQKPELTAETLRDGWMWTGDIATWDAESYVYIVDRAKDMIITGGENVYSVQVEAAIHKHPAVLEAAVIGVPDDEWGESVKAVVVLKPGQEASAKEIIDTARTHLASYQKPRSVDFVEALPKAPTGKILKRQLREPYWKNRERSV
ncbi:MAG: AMP-binding protein [Candidatus Binatia bacterium]|nr:AMP-binding protein [Candidatus Binatia bacterium]